MCRWIMLVAVAWCAQCPFCLAAQDDNLVSRIAFGSCANQNKPCPIWDVLADYQPQVTILLGDNVYADNMGGRSEPATPERIAAAYQVLLSVPGFARLKNSTRLMATWDDHDYGANDVGREWLHKEASARCLHDFLGTPTDSPRRQQAGVYDAQIFGPPGRRVQVIMLDTRYFRSPLPQAAEPLPGWRSRPYLKQTGIEAEILGTAQWDWLEEQLREPAELRILGSSIQVLSDEHPFEMWGNFPEERQRLFDLIRKCESSGVVILSGDRHLGEISCDMEAVGYPLFDVTASGLNQGHQGWRSPEPNSKRYAALPFGNHFGTIEIDWESSSPMVSLQLRKEDGRIGVEAQVPVNMLVAEPAPLPIPAGVASAKEVLEKSVGDDVVVQFYVRGGRDLTRPKRVLLNSERVIENPNNLTVVLQEGSLAGANSQANLQTYLHKTIRASGKVTLYNGRKQIEVLRAEDIDVIAR